MKKTEGQNDRPRLTLQQRLILITATLAVFVLGLIAWVGYRERNAQERELYAGLRNETASRMTELDLMLEMGQELAFQMAIQDSDLEYLAVLSEWDTAAWLRNQSVSRKLNRMFQILPLQAVPFIYYEKADIFYNGGVSPDITEKLLQRIQKQATVPLSGLWEWLAVPQGPVLYYMVDEGHYVLGLWVELSELARYLQAGHAETPMAFLTEDQSLLSAEGEFQIIGRDPAAEGLVLSGQEKSGDGQENLPIRCADEAGNEWIGFSSESLRGNFSLLCLFREEALLKNMRHPGRFIGTVLAVFLLLFVTYLFLWHRWFLKPVQLLRESMAHIQEGDSAYRIPEASYGSEEFRVVVREFNELMDHMNQLRIQLYEDELKQERTKLDYLSRQIQPHFILNTLNTLYNHSQDPETFRKLLMLTSRYYRYVVYVNSSQVPLGEEMDHIEDYLKLQKIRYPRGFEFQVSCPDELRSFPIPPFLIESFVGNAVKYGITPGEESFLSVTAGEKEDGTCFIAVQDKGEGFSEEILRAVEEFKQTGKGTEELGEGMRNSMERLILIYQDRASITFSNEGGGARVLVEIRKDVGNHAGTDCG
ncbi:MAG: histidine kinase [Lachnospiraceae bacterium]|nr:histidine kinase [Lachnospiraceae bacterium]